MRWQVFQRQLELQLSQQISGEALRHIALPITYEDLWDTAKSNKIKGKQWSRKDKR